MVRLAASALAIDLGTANTLIYELGEPEGSPGRIILNEPTMAAVHTGSGEVVGVGAEAPGAVGQGAEPITLVQPLAAGVISDIDVAEQMLAALVERVCPPRRMGSRPRVAIAVPSSVTGVERRAVAEAVYAAGAGDVELVEEPLAAAIGAGLPVEEPTPCAVVDIGGGTTEVALIIDGGIVASASLPIGGFALDESISTWARKEHDLLVSEGTAEQVKIGVGSAWPRRHEDAAEIRGRDLRTGLPKTITVSAAGVRIAMDEPLLDILGAVRATLDRCPPDLVTGLGERGIVLTGGGALLTGLPDRMADEIGLPVSVADRPLECVVLGAATFLL